MYDQVVHENKKWIQVIDRPENAHEMKGQLAETINWLENQRDQNILIHCNKGVSRSPTLVIALMMKR